MSADDKPKKTKSRVARPKAADVTSDPREEAPTSPFPVEEISSSLLVEDPLDEEPAPGSTEELSGSVLLEEPTAPARDTAVDPDTDLPTLQRPVPAPHLEFLQQVVMPRQAAGEVDDASPVDRTPTDAPPRAGLPPAPTSLVESDPSAPSAVDSQAGEPSDPTGAPESGPSPSSLRPPAAPSSDVEVTRLPNGGLGRFGAWLGRTASQGGLRRSAAWFLLALGGVVLALAFWFFTSKGSGEASAVASAPSTTPAASAGGAAEPAASAPSPAATPIATACVASGPPHVVAPSALLAAGIEARALGSDVALGFAPSEEQAIAVRVDPVSLSASDTASVHTPGPIRRVTPYVTKQGGLAAAVDFDQVGDRLKGRRTIPTDPPLQMGQIGADNGRLVWSRPGGAIKGKLWALDGEGEVEALRGTVWERMPDRPDAILVAFRRAGAVWFGAADMRGGLSSKRDLVRVPGLGAGMGSPAIAVSGGQVLAAWADRASADDPWRLRWVRFKADEPPANPDTFTPPKGGKGGQAMSPAVAALPAGRFLLVWTEGPASAHDVRALTLSADGIPIGEPLAISKEGVNAGQGQAAIGPDGRGLVAFLASDANGFQVLSTPIVCPH